VKKKILGWVLWGLGLIFAIVAANNAEQNSQIYLDIAHEVAVSSYMKSGGSLDDYELYGVLELFRDNLIQTRQGGYYSIALLMGIGTILILLGNKSADE
jgi:hypothetical protein